jgi:hypothetical protein
MTGQSMSAHALALLPPTPSPPPPAAEEACGFGRDPASDGRGGGSGAPAIAATATTIIADNCLRQPPAEDECELQNESYVSIVVLCVPVPTVDVTGPGAVGISNVFDGRNDEREADECGCVDADGGGF